MADGTDIVIIGAGLAGIACARRLTQAGLHVQVLDKGRGIGGRMATRRVTLDAGEVSFDHGAQYIRPRDDRFAQVLRDAGAQPWQEHDRLVGTPGMSQLPRDLAAGLPITQQVEISRLRQDDGQWHLTGPTGDMQARRVVLTVPAPQVPGLLRVSGQEHPLAHDLAQVRMAPSLTLMAAFAPDSPRPFVQRRDPDHPLAWIAQNSAKPGRGPAAVTWVAQAGPDCSARHLEKEPDEIAATLLPLLCDVIGVAPDTALYARAHRWRYAQTVRLFGKAFAHTADRSLYAGGDWCLGRHAEDAWHSGDAMARDILKHMNVD